MGDRGKVNILTTLCITVTFFVEISSRVARDIGHEHVHVVHVNTTRVEPNCLCVIRDTGCRGREAFTQQFDHLSTLVCGHAFQRCCFEDPWPGVVDNFAGIAPCVPQEECARAYGESPTDLRDFGVLGPCPGLGAVRCLYGVPVQPPAPVVPQPEIVVPIVPVPSVVYEPPPTQPPPPPPPPPTLAPGYDYPDETTLPPTPAPVYEPPVYEPPVVVQPPAGTYEPPTPIVPAPAPVPPPILTQPGPPYLWQSYGPWGFRKGFRLSKRIGFGYGWPFYG